MISIKNLSKKYGDFTAVDNISFNVKKGEVLGLLGPNGAGKSSTIRMLCGYLAPTSGDVKVGESTQYKVVDNPIEAKKLIGYLPESAPLYGDMIVYDYLAFVANIREVKPKSVKEKVEKIIELCGLKTVAYKTINELSKGFKQRVGLGHALIGDPEILVLDEPTSGLDPNQIIEIRKLIREIGETKTVVLCSHILSEVELTCDRIVIINKGKIIVDSLTQELKKNQGKNISIEFSNEIESELIEFKSNLSKYKITSISEERNPQLKLKIFYQGSDDIRNDIFKLLKNTNLQIINFHQEAQSLENIFRNLTDSDPLEEDGMDEGAEVKTKEESQNTSVDSEGKNERNKES